MKIVAVIGSPHGMKGSTGILLDGVLDAVRAAGAEATVFSLTEQDVQPCRGCDRCHITGHCAISDDFDGIQQTFAYADGLILASPNYIVSVSAQMKALFDRCCGLLHLQAIEGKYAAAVVTSGGPGGEEVEQYMQRFLRMLGYTTVGGVHALGWQMQNDAMRAQPLQDARRAGPAPGSRHHGTASLPGTERGTAGHDGAYARPHAGAKGPLVPQRIPVLGRTRTGLTTTSCRHCLIIGANRRGKG